MAFLFWSSLLFFVFRTWLSIYGGLHPQEAYFWTWAQNLHLGYYDHPPLIAYVIRVGQEIFSFVFGHNFSGSKISLILSFRWLPDFLGFVILPCLMGGCIKERQRHALTMSQVFCLLSTPIVIFGAQVITPDLLLFCVWAASFWLALRMQRRIRGNVPPGTVTPIALKTSICMGILWAIGGYSKYTAIFLPILFITAGCGFWNALIAGAVCIILMIPYLYWTLNVALPNHMGLFYQIDRGTALADTSIHLNWLGDMWVAQLLYWGPIFCIDYSLSFKSRRKLSWTLWTWIFLPIVFFSVTGLRTRPETTWPVMGGIALAIFVIARNLHRPIRLFWYTASNYAIIFFILWTTLNQNTLGKIIAPFAPDLGRSLQREVSRIDDFRGWENLRNLVFESTLIDQDPILVKGSHVLSPLLFYDRAARDDEKLGSRLKIYDEAGSVSQFDFESSFLLDSLSTYWIFKRGESLPEEGRCELRQSFTKADPLGEAFALFKCQNS